MTRASLCARSYLIDTSTGDLQEDGFNIEKDDSTYKRDLLKRIELINWFLGNMKDPDIQIFNLIESKMNEITLKINQTCSILKADKLHSELRILDWILYQVCT